MRRYKAIVFGLGPIGSSIARLALSRHDRIDIVGAVDANPALVGMDLGVAMGLGKRIGMTVLPTAGELYKGADIVLHATASFLSETRGQFLEFCRKKVDVISTNEELSFPWFGNKRTARALDVAAKKNDVTLLGTGVNPGFVLDALAVTLSGVCANVKEVQATRILDATKRRLPFQRKVGIGLSVEEFQEHVRAGRFGHVGLPESIAMTCAALNYTVDKVEQRISPKIATTPVSTERFGRIQKGRVIGLTQDAEGFIKNRRVASYHIEMYAGAKDPRDEITLVGEPTISLKIPGGTPGDTATAAIIVNSIQRVIDSPAGLMTVKDLRPASSVLR